MFGTISAIHRQKLLGPWSQRHRRTKLSVGFVGQW